MLELYKQREELADSGRSCWDRSKDVASMSLVSQVFAACCKGSRDFEEIEDSLAHSGVWSIAALLPLECCSLGINLENHRIRVKGVTEGTSE